MKDLSRREVCEAAVGALVLGLPACGSGGGGGNAVIQPASGASQTPQPVPTDTGTDSVPNEDRPDPVPDEDGILGARFLGIARVRKGTFGAENMRASFGPGAFAIRDGYIRLAGHVNGNGVGVYGPIDFADVELSQSPIAENLMPYVRIADRVGTRRLQVSGIFDDGARVFVLTQEYYDTNAENTDDLSVVSYDGTLDQFYETAGHARSSGWMQTIPAEWQHVLGGTHLLGGSKNLPVNRRHSMGPSLYAFDGTPQGASAAKPWMLFSMRHPLGSFGIQDRGDPVFNELSRVWTGFIRGEDYICVGRTGGIESGIAYKVRGTGYDAIDEDDYVNYYWKFRMSDITGASAVHAPRPYEYGKLNLDFLIRGANYDAQQDILYLCAYIDETQSSFEKGPVYFAYQF